MSYVYRHVAVDRVIDGDTVVISIDLGNKTTWRDSFRLAGIDTPERGQPGFDEAADRLRNLLGAGLSRAETHKPDKYGRWLVTLWVPTDGGELCANEIMLSEGLARPYHGGAK